MSHTWTEYTLLFLNISSCLCFFVMAMFLYSSATVVLLYLCMPKWYADIWPQFDFATGAWTADGRRTDRQGVSHMNQIWRHIRRLPFEPCVYSNLNWYGEGGEGEPTMLERSLNWFESRIPPSVIAELEFHLHIVLFSASNRVLYSVHPQDMCSLCCSI